MLLKIHPENPNKRKIDTVVNVLQQGGSIIYPTDTLYSFACSLDMYKKADHIFNIKSNKKASDVSIIFKDLSQVSEYARPISNDVFKLLKTNLPGAFTFIIEANNKVPKIFKTKKRTIGVRIPDHNIPIHIVEQLGVPMLTTSIPLDDIEEDFVINPELLYDKYGQMVNIVIDGGLGGLEPSTVVDCTASEIEIVRQGKGILK